ncbi:WLM domain-containing protein [Suillus tomentosus]|nr:WLM domain-containing protein [Suillus tomentosus]
MVHIRINKHKANLNLHINFISILPMIDSTLEDDAQQLMQALSTQVRPIMKAHSFTMNNFEEYEYNRVFAERNWNNGETIELVLKSASGSFVPVHWLLSTLCHELAHIKHMNRRPAFQALWWQLRNDVCALQNRGYYGDDTHHNQALLTYTSQFPRLLVFWDQMSRFRENSRPRTAKFSGPSVHTGAQSEKKRKASSRITNANTFSLSGKALNEGIIGEKKETGTGFRKKAGSKCAQEECVLAAERRMEMHKIASISSVSAFSSCLKSEITIGSESEYEAESLETGQDRRRTMFKSIGGQELDKMTATRYDFSDNCRLPGETGFDSCNIHKIECPDAAVSTDAQPSSSTQPGKHQHVNHGSRHAKTL